MISRRILEEYVKSVLLEDEGGGDYGYSHGGMGDSPYGISWGGPSLFKLFVQPFTDVLQTTQAAVADLSTRVRTAAKVAFEVIATSIIPLCNSDYKKIFDKEAHELGKIKEKYKDVFDRTNASFTYSGDAMLLAFLLDPTALISASFLRKSPVAALQVFETLAGENSRLRSFFKKLKLTSSGQGGGSERSDYGMGESILREAQPKKMNQNDFIISKLSDPKVAAELNKSSIVQSMKKDAKALINSTINQLMDQYNQINSVRTVDDLVRIYPQIDRSKLQPFQSLPADQKNLVQDGVVKQIKAAGKEFYTKSLQAQIEKSMKEGIPENHPLLQGYKKVIGMIKSS